MSTTMAITTTITPTTLTAWLSDPSYVRHSNRKGELSTKKEEGEDDLRIKRKYNL